MSDTTRVGLLKAPATRVLLFVGLLTLGSALGKAQVTVTLPDTSNATSFAANVSEQARVLVPATVTFNVINIGAATDASAVSVTVDQIVLATATKQLMISLEAGATAFTPPVVGATTWSAADVSWNAATWTAATGASGTLSASAFNTVATCDADATACSTTGLVFALAANAAVQRSGNHTLSVIWKFESIGT